jgi:hypothetical protein
VFVEMWKISKSFCRELDVALRLSRSRLKHSQRKCKKSKDTQFGFQWVSIHYTHFNSELFTSQSLRRSILMTICTLLTSDENRLNMVECHCFQVLLIWTVLIHRNREV